jgi:hypothetical protein
MGPPAASYVPTVSSRNGEQTTDPPASDVDAITIIEGHADVGRFDRKATMTALDGRLFHRRFTETMDTRGSGI